MRALQGKAKGSKPVFAPYENKVVPGKVLDQLLERGMALTRRVPAFQTQYKNCIIKKSTEEKNGVKEVCTRIETPYGVLKQVETVNDVSSYISEHFVKDENDFPAFPLCFSVRKAFSCWFSFSAFSTVAGLSKAP